VGAAVEGGEILVTAETLAPIPVRELQVGIDRELMLKGLPEPVHVVPIEWRLRRSGVA
jgi:hypothetical protein